MMKLHVGRLVIIASYCHHLLVRGVSGKVEEEKEKVGPSSAWFVASSPNRRIGKNLLLRRLEEPISCTEVLASLENIAESLDPTTVFSGNVVFPSTPAEYNVATDQYANYTYPGRLEPSFVVLSKSETDVRAAVIFAKQCAYKVSIRSGGHSYLAVSSCSSLDQPCIQIDVGELKDSQVDAETAVVQVGPGFRLDELSVLLDANGLFLPTGICAKVGIGGHIQTGGYGLWAPQFGPLATRVEGFRIVLSDGVVADVVKPASGTTELNDNLFYAVLGGASGSWGVITKITLDAIKTKDYFSVFWSFPFVWNTDAAVNLIRTLADKAQETESDHRWSYQIIAAGLAPLNLPNLFRIQLAWVDNDSADYNPAFFQEIIDAYTKVCPICGPVPPLPLVSEESMSSLWLPQNKNIFEESLSSSWLRHLAASGGWEFDEPFRHYSRSWQQTSIVPSADAMENIIRGLGNIMPSHKDQYAFISQPARGAPFSDRVDISLPWPDGVFGTSIDIFYPSLAFQDQFHTMAKDFAQLQIDNYGGIDNRMYWGAYEETVNVAINIIEEQGKYFDSATKFSDLRAIKTLVDPDDVFHNIMSMPPDN